MFSKGKEKLGFAIGAGESQLFRYRVLLLDAAPTAEDMERHYAEWTGAAKGSAAADLPPLQAPPALSGN